MKDQEGRASGKERGLRETKAGSVEQAARPIHVPGEDAPAQIQIQDLAEYHAPQRCPLTLRRPGLRHLMPSLTIK
jgi:hypothetical protein